MTVHQPHAIAQVLLDALTALDPADHDASVTAVPLALARLEDLTAGEEDPAAPVAYGAMTLANACVALVASLKGVDRLDVIAALRPLFDHQDQGAGGSRGHAA
ncbi:hypothetical protein [Cellulomonas bogoriensis]|uniref:Uncharacterized protein n=1 Tax=Cellulomonas bogoriensis 69B4 = DSM 16987 TaxID=1386082 RepID=A0A0A0BZU7_9CELL|nr:hypothetical protein [Cellulomonas bogoriensis]KGM13466.1 hypothetical protein N869_13845 [Cellulomonas bogoriensis 69B4 = DSM 16987]